MLIISNEKAKSVITRETLVRGWQFETNWVFKLEFTSYEDAKSFIKEAKSEVNSYNFRIRTRGKWTSDKKKRFGDSRPRDLKVAQADRFIVYAYKD